MSEHTTTTTFSSKQFLFLAIIFFCIVAGIVFSQNRNTSFANEDTLSGFTFSHSVFEELVLNAEVSYVKNTQTQEIVYQKNASKIFPLASLTKIMTAYTAKEILGDTSVVIESQDMQAEGDHGLVVGEVWHIDDLLVFMLVTSSNDAAEAVARTAQAASISGKSFPELMEEQASKLGLTTLSFENPSGLDIEGAQLAPSALGSAEDISNLFVHATNTYPHIFSPTRDYQLTLSSSEKDHTFKNTNTSLSILPSLEGSKTGYTQTAGGNLSVITQINGEPHVVTVLRSTREGRFQDIGTIINKTKESL